MTPTVSIVIPTFTRTDKLRDCLRSIVAFTNPENVTVVVVANGASEETRIVFNEFYGTWQGDAKLLWFDEPMGYPRPVNEGIRATDSEYVVLLNDDAELLPQPKNEWMDTLLQPMLADELIGLTGPLEQCDENSNQWFLIFFCVMIRREVFTSIGMLDETFKYFGEDTDLCIRARNVGWKVLRVPEAYPTELKPLDPSTTTIEAWKHDKVHTGNFGIWHDAESTIGRLADSEEVLRESRAILRERYGKKEPKVGINIDRALATDGWMADDELRFLAETAAALPKGGVFVEIGSWHGRSTRAIADNLPEGCIMLAVDTWTGSSGEPEMHESAKLREGDHAHSWWWCNLHHEILAGKVIPVRMHSANAAECLNHMGLKADVIWIDADHSYEGIKQDVISWSPIMKEGGLWCGHDYYTPEEEPFAWIGVRTCVNEMFPDAKKVAHSIWASHANPVVTETKSAVYDCFPVNNELDLLEVRFSEMDEIVDRWVITEARLSHSNKPKPLYFWSSIQSEPERWAKWLPKITHIIVEDFDVKGLAGSDLHWQIERHQRDAIMRGLTQCKDHDTIIISDADEIPRAEAVKTYSIDRGLCALDMNLYYGSMNCQELAPWREGRILTYGLLKVMTPCSVRYTAHKDLWKIDNGGWHFSFMGGPDEWVKKLEATAHQEYNKPEFKDQGLMERRVRQGADLLGRDIPYKLVEVGASFPKFVTDNLERFKANHFIYGHGTPSNEINLHPLAAKEEEMHPEANWFVGKVKEEYPEFFSNVKVLECGSLDINGSVRQFFTDCDYTGIDVGPGPGVDYVISAHDFRTLDDAKFDVVISSEMLEHDRTWMMSLDSMYLNLKPGGLMVITCAGPKRPEHGTTKTDTYSSPFTTDYYRNISAEDLQNTLPPELWNDAEWGYGRGGEDLYFRGIKLGEPAPPPFYMEVPVEVKDGKVEVPAITIPPANVLDFKQPDTLARKKHWTVTAEVCTKDRYTTTLPLTLSAIINQTHKPDRLVIYDDSENRIEPEKLAETSPFDNLLKLASDKKIEWVLNTTPRKGQVTNHQHCLDSAETDFIWRVDDDEIPEPNCLEVLLNTVRDAGPHAGDWIEQVGAVGGLVHHPSQVSPLPVSGVDGSLGDVAKGLNLQWFQWNGSVRETQHLYSTFLYSVAAAKAAGGYPRDLSSVGHREETIFSHQLVRAGYKVLVTPYTKTYHLREATGGIRSFNDNTLWEHDEQIFQAYLRAWNIKLDETKLIVCDFGLGDHLIVKGIWPELKRKFPDRKWTLALCCPQVFENEPDVTIISIADAKLLLGNKYEGYSAYKYAWDNNFVRPMPEVMMEFFSK